MIRLFKHPKSGLITIWCDVDCYQQYYFYSKREAVKLFKKKYGIRGKVVEVDWCLWAF